MDELPKQRWGCLQWAIVSGVVFLLGSLIIPVFSATAKIGDQAGGVRNCKELVMALNVFFKENGSVYPDAGPTGAGADSVNQIFHRLFEEELVTNERIFGCPNSVFVPDGKIGAAPDFDKALTPGECHWMLLKFQTETSVGDTPIVVENALNASWPPKWNVSDQAGNKRGRAWPGHWIIIGRHDGSVVMGKLNPDGIMDWQAQRKSAYGDKSWIDTLTPEQAAKLSYWDIEEK